MKVIDKKSDGVFLLQPENDWEGINNLEVFMKAGVGGELLYGGRSNEKGGIFFSIRLKTEDKHIIVAGTAFEDKRNIAKIRSLCFHGTLLKGMILHGFTSGEYGIGLALTAVYCVNCGRPMNERVGWKICRACADEICPHERYEPRVISDDEGIFLCKICTKCGLLDPLDFLRTRSLSEEERIKEIQEVNPTATFTPIGMDPRRLPLAIRTALRSNN
ncbi:hypothetical protein M1413_02245 [Patescibacteria group bacterium]|nr:hypothetical protein [Patescibacteria group bacterium]MCL5114812.1 hypothetical protein [Patescibacteria group bacterium]